MEEEEKSYSIPIQILRRNGFSDEDIIKFIENLEEEKQ